jgi:hypothetical protein
MGVFGWLVIVVVILVVLFAVFVFFRHRKRSGGVIATKGKP